MWYNSTVTVIRSILLIPIFITLVTMYSYAQEDACNHLGVWLWRMEHTGFDSYEKLADSLHNMGVKRIYVKVADGRPDTTAWPTLVNKNIITTFHDRSMEVYAWSYNYPGNDGAQAQALTKAISTGYDGYVIDIEMQFDNETILLENLVSAFYDQKNIALVNDIIDSTFTLGVTTWGNPADHNFRIDIMDPYVDAYFPQTYLEVWGESYLDNPAYWVEVGNREYRDLGATKPIHHIISTEYNIINADQLNAFIGYAGGQTSIWRIPGGATTFAIWQDWVLVDWDKDFCELTSADDAYSNELMLYPNPVIDILHLTVPDSTLQLQYQVVDILGHIILKGTSNISRTIDVTSLNSGYYNILISHGDKRSNRRVIKL
jgi:hypothetical protein